MNKRKKSLHRLSEGIENIMYLAENEFEDKETAYSNHKNAKTDHC